MGRYIAGRGLRKLPLDHPKRENQPSFRLTCEHAANGAEQVQLRIEGEKHLVLSGEGGGALGYGNKMWFDPASVSVRLLQGQPSLYWIRQDYLSEGAGGVGIDTQRHWVVQKGDTGQTVLDEQTEVYEQNRNGFDWSNSEDLAIVYQGSTLRVIKTTYLGETFADTENEPGEPDYRESFSTESLAKATREMDAGTGRTISEKTVQAQIAPPYLILDDGIAGWLRVTKPDFHLVSWEFGQEVPRSRLPDPEKLGEIPSGPACWLYNRIPWDQANASRPYPPAPPDQVRSSHFAPDVCCAVQTSKDGRRVTVHESKSKEERREPGRLLALFDVPTGRCWSANLAQSGRWGWAPFDRIGDPVFSPDGRRLGFRAQRGERRFVVVDDREGPPYHRVSAPAFSPDSRHVAYWVRNRGKEFIVLDDKPGPAFDGAGFPVFSPDSGKLAYRARQGNQWVVVLGDRKGPTFDDIGYYQVPDSGRGTDIADVVISPDGRQLAYAARRGEQWLIVRDRQPGPGFEHVGLPVFSPDGRHLAHRARQDDREFIVLDGHRGPDFDFVGTPVFSPDGRDLAYWARKGEQELVVNGKQSGRGFADPGQVGAPVFADNGRGPIYWAREAAMGKDGYVQTEVLMVGDQPGPTSEYIFGPVLNRHSGELAYWVRERNSVFVMHGGRPGPRFDSHSLGNLVFSPYGRLLAHRAGRVSNQFIHFGDQDDAEFDAVGDPVFSPGGDQLAYRARGGDSWFPIIVPLTGQASSPAEPRLAAPVTLPLSQTVPRLIPHPIAVGDWIVGGSTRDRWIKPDAVATLDIQHCKPLGPEWIDPGLRWTLYAFDRPLGECRADAPAACVEEAYGSIRRLQFTACAVQDYLFAVAGPWNALPRRPKILEDHHRFVPLVRKMLDDRGLTGAPARIAYVHAIDLDGDGSDERIINARSSEHVPESCSANDYSLLLLAMTRGGKPQTAVVKAWWPGDEATCGSYVTYDSFYADANGDGMMEVFVDWSVYERDALRIYTLEAGRPVSTPIVWHDSL